MEILPSPRWGLTLGKRLILFYLKRVWNKKSVHILLFIILTILYISKVYFTIEYDEEYCISAELLFVLMKTPFQYLSNRILPEYFPGFWR